MKLLLTPLLLVITAAFAVARPDLSNGRPGPTPYDPYNAPVNAVMGNLNSSTPSFATVRTLLRQGYNFRYSFDTPYVAQMPAVTASKHAGDCKAKSLWLASKMNDAENVRYVIGRARSTSRISHAWLMWKHEGRWWILDPTNVPEPIPANSVGSGDYVINYSYDRTGSYLHSPVNGSRRVAGH